MMAMRRKTLLVVALSAAWGPLLGCSQEREARYVYRDGRYGVIALDSDTKTSRQQAAKLMSDHFPGGYEIVREEEIDTGSRKSEQAQKQASAIKPGAGVSRLLVGIGESSRSSEKNYQDELRLHEVRIIYRSSNDKQEAGYTALSSATPEMYADPNKAIRHLETTKVLTAGAKNKGDSEVKKASKDD
jgi:hypothetical protein